MRLVVLAPLIAIFIALSGCTTTSVSDAYGDTQNESLAERRIADAHPGLKDAKVKATSFNGVVLLTGQVPSADLRPIATAAVGPLRAVSRVHKDLEVASKTTLISRTNDSWITTKVKSALLADETAQAGSIKVVTENDVVYLMGLVSRAEADAAVKVVQEIKGVRKIVKIFDYIN